MRSRYSALICFLVTLLVASAASAQVSSGEFTYAIEVNDVICGYADVHLSTVDAEDGTYTLFKQKTFIMMSALGSEFNTTVEITGHIDPITGDCSLLQVHVRQAELEVDFGVQIDGNVARCTSSLQDEVTFVTLAEDVIVGNPLYNLHLLRDFADGEMATKTCAVFDGREFDVQETTYTWGGRETLELGGKRYEAFIIDSLGRSSGVKARTWLDSANGMILKSSDPRGQTVYLADPSVRKRIELANVDENILVRTNASITDIQSISYMKVKAVLEPTGQWFTPEDLTVPGQRFSGTITDNLVEGVFEIEHPRYDGAGAPPYPLPAFEDESLRAYLHPDEFTESDDPVLIDKARELAEGSADSWEAACRLSQWVADEIAYEIPGGGTARRTYDLRAGECGAHSILLATFCRSLGIPARVVWGCMYSPNHGGAFGQHGWTEVYMGEAGWIPVDSTAHEAGFVDSGHVRLGILQSHSVALNAKSMEVLDYRTASSTDDDPPSTNHGAYAAYLGEYEPPGGGEPFTVQTSNGNLAIDIPGRMVLTFKDPDRSGKWFCTLSNNLAVTFEQDNSDRVVAFSLHERVRMRRIGAPAAIGNNVPDALRPYLGDYRFPGRPEPFTISFDDGRLAAWYESRQALVHMEPTNDEGRWIDEFGGNVLTFDRDDDGEVSALILEVVNTFRRRLKAATDIDVVLDEFHRAATNADFDAYFACLAPDAVVIGTDATERWTVDELRAFAKPYFDQGSSRAHTSRDRHVNYSPGGDVAYFDELVDIESLGECRGTGVLIKLDDAWLIAQYGLSFAVPNEIVFDVVDRIRESHDERTVPPTDDDAGIRASLEAYLATATFPESTPADPQLFAADIVALWSNGKTYRGRASMMNALADGRTELEEAFVSFGAWAEEVHVERRGNVAWVTCRIKMNGTLMEGGGPFATAVRSTFVFEYRNDRWQMVSEHSSLVSDDQQG